MISNTTLTTSYTSIYTSSSNSIVSLIYLCNTTATAVSVDVCAVPSGGSAGVSTQIYSSLEIPGYDTFVIDTEKFVLANGDAVHAQANVAASVIATVSSMSI